MPDIKISNNPQEVPVRTIKISKRERTPHEALKLATIKEFLDIIASEDLDPVILAILKAAKAQGYNLQGTPEEVLAALNALNALKA